MYKECSLERCEVKMNISVGIDVGITIGVKMKVRGCEVVVQVSHLPPACKRGLPVSLIEMVSICTLIFVCIPLHGPKATVKHQ